MRSIRRLLLFFLLIGFIWLIYEEDIKSTSVYSFVQKMTDDLMVWKESPNVQSSLEQLEKGMDQALQDVKSILKNGEEISQNKVEKPALSEPDSHSFSVHNIEIGDTREQVENLVGSPKRSTVNEYGINWNAYHNNYQNFFMVAYNKENKVAGLYTNQDLISSKQGVSLGTPMEDIIGQFGEPLTAIQKNWVSYQINNNGEFYLYKLDQSYITFFFDKHEGNTITAIQIISEELENQKAGYYADGSQALREGFEYQLFDLTNAARVEHGLHPLTWDEHVRITAREHSADMAIHQYFDHTNLEGQSPFDRMKEDQIYFRVAGENLAAGQLSSIFAHEGLMNSLGHRENILKADFETLGIGVAFDIDKKPFYTQNFVTR